MYYLYSLNFPNLKKYIGITNNLKRRWSAHKCNARKGSTRQYVHFAIRKYGEDNIKLEVLAIGEKEYIRNLERRAIEKFETRNPEIGYNLAIGGEMSPVAEIGHTHTSKLKMSMSQKLRIRTPEEIAKMTASLQGRIFSENHKQKLSISATGRILSASTKLKIALGNRKETSYSTLVNRKPKMKTVERLKRVAELIKKECTTLEIATELNCSTQYACRLIRRSLILTDD